MEKQQFITTLMRIKFVNKTMFNLKRVAQMEPRCYIGTTTRSLASLSGRALAGRKFVTGPAKI